VHFIGFITRIYFQIFCKRAVFLSIVLFVAQYANKILRFTLQNVKLKLSGFKTANPEAF